MDEDQQKYLAGLLVKTGALGIFASMPVFIAAVVLDDGQWGAIGGILVGYGFIALVAGLIWHDVIE